MTTNETYLKNDFGGFLDERVLIRDDKVTLVTFRDLENKLFTEYANLCFVISIKKNKIVTCYWNIAKDSHDSINWNRYDENLQIIKGL